MPTLALLDGHSLAFRAFYALPSDLATSSGQVTNAAYGFTSMLIKLLTDEHPDAVAVAWDTGGETFRTEAFADYKAQRESPPDLFRSQLPLIEEVATVMEIPQFAVAGYEADDIIATLARRAEALGWEVLIVTGDRDAFQLIDEHVRVLYTRRGISDTVTADAAYVEERYGITPGQYVDFAALRGDTSDNIPGVPGVGEKTAAKLLTAHGDLDGVFEHLEDQTPKLRQSLAEHREQVMLNRRLIRLVEDAPADADPEELRLAAWKPEAVRKVFEGLEFHSLWKRLQEMGGSAPPEAGEVLEVEVRTLLDEADVAHLAARSELTVEPVWDGGRLAGLMVVEGDARVAFLPDPKPLASALADPALPKRMHDAKPTLAALADLGLAVEGVEFDTALAAYVLNPARRDFDLGDIAAKVLNVEMISADAVDEAGDQGVLALDGGPDLDTVGRRALAIDRLVGPLTDSLEAREAAELYRRIELPLIPVLVRMEEEGIGVDRDYLEELGESLRDRLADLERKIHRHADEPFNVNSTLQLREVLYDRLGLPVLKKTPKGQPSTDASVLEKLVDEHPIVELLLRYRELEKLRSTYVDGLLPLVAADGRVHARFNQMAATTGRLSSEHPNLQNIPVRSEEGRTIRRAFVPREGWTFVVADYSQIELRILAHLTEDPGLLEAFAAGEDIHAATAARVAGTTLDEVSPAMRRRAKVINFGLIYGMEAFGLAQRLEIEREEAAEQIEAYFAQFPRVRDFMEGVVARAHADGYTTTIFGRRRYLPELASNNYRVRQMGERMALNAPIQGSAADIIKLAMIAVDAELRRGTLPGALLLQVHDELVLECPPEAAEEVAGRTAQLMAGVAELAVPLEVDVATGANLAECKG